MNLRSVIFGSVALLGLAVPASATVITGHIGFSGGVIYDNRMNQALNINPGGCLANPANLTCGASTLDFVPLGQPNGQNIIAVAGVTGYFAGMGTFPPVLGAETASILDLTNDPTAVGPTFAPSGTTGAPFPIAGFLSAFTGAAFYNGLHFDLTQIPNAGGTPCTGSETGDTSCAEGPFTLTHTIDGMKIQFDVRGNFVNGADFGLYAGSFSVVLNGLTFPVLWDRLLNTGQDLMCGANNLSTSCSFTANFDEITGVPEPATLLTFGFGAAALAKFRRRKTAKA